MSSGIYEAPLSAIALAWKWYPRYEVDENRVLEFRELLRDPEAAGRIPPIDLVRDPERPGRLFVADGAHRAMAFHDEGRDTIPAIILPDGTDVYLHAVQRAAISAKPLTRKEKRAAVNRILQDYPDWSNHRIADTLGVSRPFVARVRSGETVPMAGDVQGGNVSADVGEPDYEERAVALPQFGPNLAQQALKFLVRAYEKGHGRTKFGFGKDINPKAIRTYLDQLHDDDRPHAIQALQAWGAALADVKRWLPTDGGA